MLFAQPSSSLSLNVYSLEVGRECLETYEGAGMVEQ